MPNLRIIVALLLATVILTQRTAFADAWPGTTIGDGFGVQAKPERTSTAQLKKIHDLGFHYVRYDMWWNEIELEPGVYDWSKLDKFLAAMRKAHLKSIIILQGNNRLYSPKVSVPPEDAFGASWTYAAPANDEARKAFVAFAVAAVARFGTDDILWEIWNEPDGLAFWPPKADPIAFSLLADQTCRAIRKAAPQAKIVGPAIARLPNQFDFLHRDYFMTFIQSPVKNCLNAITVHPYRFEHIPETVIDDYKTKVRPFIESYTDKGQQPLPIFDGESGYSLAETTPEQQAAFALRMHLSDLLSGVPLSILYEWQDSPHMSEDREMHFGMVDANGHDKAGAAYLSSILPQIKNAVLIKRLSTNNDDAFVVLIQQPDKRYQLLAWMGVKTLDHQWTLQIGDGAENPPTSHLLSLQPQVFSINSPDAAVAVIETPPETP